MATWTGGGAVRVGICAAVSRTALRRCRPALRHHQSTFAHHPPEVQKLPEVVSAASFAERLDAKLQSLALSAEDVSTLQTEPELVRTALTAAMATTSLHTESRIAAFLGYGYYTIGVCVCGVCARGGSGKRLPLSACHVHTYTRTCTQPPPARTHTHTHRALRRGDDGRAGSGLASASLCLSMCTHIHTHTRARTHTQPCGEEMTAALALALRPTDPAALHYRHLAALVARQLQRGTPLDAILQDRARGYTTATTDPVTSGAHCSLGGDPNYDFLVTSTLASQGPQAVGRALAIGHLPQAKWPSDAISLVSCGDGSVNNAEWLSAINAAEYIQVFSLLGLVPLEGVEGAVAIHILTYTHTRIQTHTCTTHTNTYTHTHIHTYTHPHIHTYTHTHIHTYTHTHIHTYIHAHMHTYNSASAS